MTKVNKKFQAGLLLMSPLLCLALVGIFLSTTELNRIQLDLELCVPQSQHIFGCDVHGRDVLALLSKGAGYSLSIAITATVLSLGIGVFFGAAAAMFGGIVDSIFLLLLETVLAFPGTLLAIGLATLLGSSVSNLIFTLTITGWTSYARFVRVGTLALKNREYVEAAKAIGLGRWQILTKHILPNLYSSILVLATFSIGGNILTEASLSFLGIGLPPNFPSWGSMLNSGREVLFEAPHVSTVSGIAIAWTILGFHLLGEGLSEKWNPRLLEKNR